MEGVALRRLRHGEPFTEAGPWARLCKVCGRYALAGDFSDFTAEFALEEIPGWNPRYNIAPSAGPGFEVPIVKSSGVEFARFWYIPAWWNEPVRALPSSFNARVETAFHKRFFHGAERCLVPTSGWREFPGVAKKKRAFHFYLPPKVERSHPPGEAGFFAFCGISSRFHDPDTGKVGESFAILTTEPSEVVRRYHHRMPLLAAPEQYRAWLDPAHDVQQVLPHCLAYSHAAPLVSYECSTYGNSTRHEGRACIAPVAEQRSLF